MTDTNDELEPEIYDEDDDCDCDSKPRYVLECLNYKATIPDKLVPNAKYASNLTVLDDVPYRARIIVEGYFQFLFFQ